MLTELEIEAIIADENLRAEVYELKKRFLMEEAPYMEISDQDFLGLILLAPSLKIALADGSVSFFEEKRLNKKARSYSKGKYWLKKDPVTTAMNFLLKKFDKWEEEFFSVLKNILKITFNKNDLLRNMLETGDVSSQSFKKDILNAPNLFKRMMVSFFVDKDEELIKSKNISQLQFETIKDIGTKLEFDNLPLFQRFIKTYNVKA